LRSIAFHQSHSTFESQALPSALSAIRTWTAGKETGQPTGSIFVGLEMDKTIYASRITGDTQQAETVDPEEMGPQSHHNEDEDDLRRKNNVN
jgi:hypothetical protein